MLKCKSILSHLEDTVHLCPSKPALIYENSTLTFEKLDIFSNQLAHYLKQRGNFSNIPLCFCLDQSLEKVIAMLAIWKAEGAYVSLDPLYPEARLQHVLEDTESPLLITTRSYAEKFSFFKGQIILIDEQKEEIKQMPESTPKYNIAEGMAYLAYTSGSTGVPKAVMAEHKGLNNFVEQFGIFLDPQKEDTALTISSSNFDGIVVDLWVPLSKGMTVFLYPDNRMVGEPLLHYIRESGITMLPYLPVSILATLPTDQPIGKLRKICTGGEAPIPSVIESWKKRTELINIYGPTETTVVVSGFKFDENHPITTIGKPLPNVDFYVLDDEMNPLPANETGELYIGGIQVARGYYNRPDLTAERFLEYKTPENKTVRVYKTGDLVRRLKDDTIEFVGRADQQVKVRGFRVEPAEIEENIRQSGLVENCIIIVKQKKDLKQLICFYKNKKNKNSYPEDIRTYLFERLPSYMIPFKFLEVESFPLTANGKIDKSVLSTDKVTEEKRKFFVAPQSPLQNLLADAWSAILGIRSIGIYDNFFHFGGNSILAYRLVSLLRREFNLSLQAADLFLYPSIHELENYITEQDNRNQTDEIDILDQYDPVPLSSQQQNLWFIDKLYGSTPYNIGVLYPMHKDVSFSILENALHRLVKKHSILRTTIEEKDNHPYVSVTNADHWLLHTQHSSDNIKNLVTIPFDLQRDYMLRAYIIYDSNTAVSLLLVMHHMVTDGWSMPLIAQEINTLYQEIINNKAGENFNPIIEYKHYAVWQSKQNIGDGITFWKEYLEDVPVLQTAHDFKKLHNHVDSGEQYQFEIDEELTENLKKISEEQSATLYMTLLSAFSLLMQYYSGQQDICIGSPSANRPHPFDKTIGYFANMLPIRIKIDGNPAFVDFLQQIRNMIPQIFRHQGVPIDIIISQVIKDRFAGHNPLFQNIFVLQDPVETSENSFPVQTEKVQWIHNKRIKFDLQFEVLQTDGKLKVNIDYSDALFKKQTIMEMAARFRYLLQSITLDPNQKIGDIDLYSAVSEKKIETQKQIEIPKTLVQMFEEQVQKTPDKTALIISGISISYRSLDEKSSCVANHLIHLGIKRGDFAACYHEQSIERIISLLGVLKAGAAYVPLDTTYPMERIKLLLEDTQPKVIIGSAKFSQIKREVNQPVYFIEDLLKNRSETILQSYCSTHTHTDLAYVIHTSGTTGMPKGVLIEHQSLGNFITEYGNLLDISEEDRTLQFSPYNFDGSVIDLWIPLTKGATVHLYPNNKLLGEHLSEFLFLHAITVIPFISPSVLSTLSQTFDLPSIRVIGTGAETCPSQVSQHWKPLVKLVNMYGPTETTVAVNEFVFDDIHPDHTIGTAINNMRLYVLDQYLRKVPAGVTGELYISGIQLSRGYLNQPELTAEKFIKNHFINEESNIYSRMYKTGDQVKTLSDGMLEYIGRSDHQVKVRGYRIELAEIENALLQIKGIKNAKVQVHKASETIKSLRAFVTGDSHISNIRSELSRKIPTYMVPNEIFTVDIIPLKSNGKIDMEALASLAQHKTAAPLEMEDEPCNEYEKVIKEIWTEVLECRIPGMEDDFFHLGGHSLLLTKMYNKLFKKFPNTITLSELYTNSTIRKQALLIEEREKNPHTLHYGLGKDPLSDEIRKDADVKHEKFKFNISIKGNFENPEEILLTGVTGFVGVNMLVELLKSTAADIYLLIRADDERAAEKRLLKAMEDQLIPLEMYDKKRVILLPGDLTKPFLGLTPQKYEDLTKTIDVVHYAGSAVNFIQPYSYMRAANVDALHTMIQFVTTYKLKQLSLLSTVGVFSWEHYFTKPAMIMENTDSTSAFKYLSRDMGYIQSKWVMEQVAQAAIRQGVPIVIFRLGYVFCHSLTGATARYQWWGLLVKTCIQLKAYPILIDQKEELVMVDFVSKAIAHIAKNSDSIGEIFHLSPEAEDNMTVMEFFELLHTELNFDLKPIPYLEWRALWENDENSPLYPLLSLFKFPAYDHKSIIEIHQNTPDFDISNTNRFLKGSSIENTKINRATVEAFCKYLGVL
ncbi:amino acid adenylation domain-containing protein/thioester reductase domain-containing protein [Chryseobacterium carnipullorum]|uniref:non-ribosomal peptide synthetase n=1 Tax=Chryseobacterium carnipullorum TaxID=1124835 RepID=UPI0009128713|nr:non-ribosomal peptide synthetase [Chryseobacterium carnipullorum]SHM85414.1 amino acid adenylation domain-containing protein/thioester reductase domain-containing protein [Chryseobacterium carnipullorum]